VRRYAKHLAFLNWCNSFNELKASCNLWVIFPLEVRTATTILAGD
jgi:hypothetical protein